MARWWERRQAHDGPRHRCLIIDSGATTVIPTITSEAELLEHVGAAGVPELSGEELERVSELYEHNEPVGA